MKPIIVVFIGGYLPGGKYGGPVTSIENFVNQFYDTYDIRIICNDHDFKDITRYKAISEGWNKVGNAQVYYTNEKDYNSKKFIRIIEPFKEQIKLFYLSGIYYIKMNYAAIIIGRKYKIPVILAPRGDLMRNTITMKSKRKMVKKVVFLKFAKVLRLFSGVYFQATSDEEEAGIKDYLSIPESFIFNIPNLPVINREKSEINKQSNSLRILFISRLMIKKNPLLAVKILEKVSPKYNVTFDIYGPKEDEGYWIECEEAIKNVNENNRNVQITYQGSLKPDIAKGIYGEYDCFLFPTVSENYGHVIVESMFSDCPVILSSGTTPWDDYANNGGYIIDLDDMDSFVCAIEELADMGNIEYSALINKNRMYIQEKFKVQQLKQKYEEMLAYVARSEE